MPSIGSVSVALAHNSRPISDRALPLPWSWTSARGFNERYGRSQIVAGGDTLQPATSWFMTPYSSILQSARRRSSMQICRKVNGVAFGSVKRFGLQGVFTL